MTSHDSLKRLGLFDARVPRYTSYPPANHFTETVGPQVVSDWLRQTDSGARVSLYLHIPYCRRLCWFCACRTQGTATDRPLAPYLEHLFAELAIIDGLLPKDVELSHIHLGGGTPTLLPPTMLKDLGVELASFRRWSSDVQFSVEIDPTEVDQERITALIEIGMTRASIGVQDFDPAVQECIGRKQSFEDTRNVVNMLRDAGVESLNMDLLYGLPHQTQERLAESVQRVLSLHPDRVALYGYAHVPWMAKRQVLIPTDALPSAEARLDLFDAARQLFLWDGYQEIGIDHFATKEDSLSQAANNGTLRRNFQGYTDDVADMLIGVGASAISQYPQGYAQNHSTSSRYTSAISGGALSTVRGHVFSEEDKLRGRLIEQIMCQFKVDISAFAEVHQRTMADVQAALQPILAQFPDHTELRHGVFRITKDARLIARLVANALDSYTMPEGRHSRAL